MSAFLMEMASSPLRHCTTNSDNLHVSLVTRHMREKPVCPAPLSIFSSFLLCLDRDIAVWWLRACSYSWAGEKSAPSTNPHSATMMGMPVLVSQLRLPNRVVVKDRMEVGRLCPPFDSALSREFD